jgi:hypothetical protein
LIGLEHVHPSIVQGPRAKVTQSQDEEHHRRSDG